MKPPTFERKLFHTLPENEQNLLANGGAWNGETFGVPTATTEQSNQAYYEDGEVLHFYLEPGNIYSIIVYTAAALSTAVRKPLENGARTFITFSNNTNYALVYSLLESGDVLGTLLTKL